MSLSNRRAMLGSGLKGIPNNEIWYTNGSTTNYTTPNKTDAFGVGIISNTYDVIHKCWRLKFEGKVTSIGDYAFNNCSNLTSVTIPDGVTSIGYMAFSYCSSLQGFKGKFASDDSRCLIIDGVLKSFAPAGRTKYTIPDSVTTIGVAAFYGCSSLTSVIIGDSVTEIGWDAFYNCSSLTSATIGDSVTTIGDRTFFDCSSLKSVTIGDSVTTIGSGAFFGCSSLTSVIIPDSVTTIGGSAFYDCKGLSYVDIPNSVKTIGNSVFYNCSNNVNGTLVVGCNIRSSNTSTDKNSGVFYGSKFNQVIIKDNVSSIGENAFYNCVFQTVFFENGVSDIASNAFSGCSNFTIVKFSKSADLTLFNQNAFQSANNISYVNIDCDIPANAAVNNKLYGIDLSKVVLSIGAEASYDEENSRYENKIGAEAFKDCTIDEVIIWNICPPTNTITLGIGENAFKGCKSILKVYCNIPNGYVNTQNKIRGYFANGGFTDIEILQDGLSNKTTEIGSYAFAGCNSATSITIPDGINTIGKYAFYKCESLEKIDIPDSVTSIGDYAISECRKLQYVVIGENAEMGYLLLYNSGNNDGNDVNSKLTIKCKDALTTKGDIPNESWIGTMYFKTLDLTNVETIGSGMFRQCFVDEIIFGDNIKTIGEDAFFNRCSYKNDVIKIKIPSLKKWCGITFENECANPIPLHEEYEYNKYESELYVGANLVTDIEIGDTNSSDMITGIGKYAFYGYQHFENIYFGNKTKAYNAPTKDINIGLDAFKNIKNSGKVILTWAQTDGNSKDSTYPLAGDVKYNNLCAYCNRVFYENEYSNPTNFNFYYTNKQENNNITTSSLQELKNLPLAMMCGNKGKIASSSFDIISDGNQWISEINKYAFARSQIARIWLACEFDGFKCVYLLDGTLTIGEGAFKDCANLSRFAVTTNMLEYNYYNHGMVLQLTLQLLANTTFKDLYSNPFMGLYSEYNTKINNKYTHYIETPLGVNDYNDWIYFDKFSVGKTDNMGNVGSNLRQKINGITEIKKFAYAGFNAPLRSYNNPIGIDIDSKVKTIGEGAFYNCGCINEIIFNNANSNYISFGKDAFYYDSDVDKTTGKSATLSAIKFSDQNKTSYIFSDWAKGTYVNEWSSPLSRGYAKLYYSNGTTYFDALDYQYKISPTEENKKKDLLIDFGSLTKRYVNQFAFYNAYSNVVDSDKPDSIVIQSAGASYGYPIHASAFYGMPIKSIVIDRNCNSIGECAFKDCKNVETIRIGTKSFTTIALTNKNCIGKEAFALTSGGTNTTLQNVLIFTKKGPEITHNPFANRSGFIIRYISTSGTQQSNNNNTFGDTWKTNLKGIKFYGYSNSDLYGFYSDGPVGTYF